MKLPGDGCSCGPEGPCLIGGCACAEFEDGDL